MYYLGTWTLREVLIHYSCPESEARVEVFNFSIAPAPQKA